MIYKSLIDICDMAEKDQILFWQVIQGDDCRERQVSESESFDKMQQMYQVMIDTEREYCGDRRSKSGLIGGDGQKLEKFVNQSKNLSGDFTGKVMVKALKIAETNACMGRIVATPTAGSCGILPSVMLTYNQEMKCEESEIVHALYTAAGIGQIIAAKSSVSGASGGCQAEIGSASAMTAGALTQLRGGDSDQICSAVGIALKGLLGLTCDPVAGLVEVPCVKRNVLGAVNAISASDMVMAGIRSALPADEIIEAMGEIGRDMSVKYKETSLGGLAVTKTAQRIRENMRSDCQHCHQ